jgi:hypothetical protein
MDVRTDPAYCSVTKSTEHELYQITRLSTDHDQVLANGSSVRKHVEKLKLCSSNAQCVMLRDDYIRKHTKVWSVVDFKKCTMNLHKRATHTLNENLYWNTFSNSEWINIQRPGTNSCRSTTQVHMWSESVAFSFTVTDEIQDSTPQ